MKFRIWNKTQRKWVTDLYLSVDGELVSPAQTADVVEVGNEDYIIQKFTGFKDLNGLDVYDGDITRNCDYRFVVTSDYFGPTLLKRTGIAGGLMFMNDSNPYLCHEIIGNILENPELL